MLHVPMWFTMFLLMGIAFVASIRQLSQSAGGSSLFDLRAEASVQVGMVFGVLGLLTGSLWARYTWGAWWVDDPQLNGALVTVLVYAGYLILRGSVEDERLKARLAAVYNLFAFVILMILLMVLPRFTESLHPAKEAIQASIVMTWTVRSGPCSTRPCWAGCYWAPGCTASVCKPPD